MKDYWAGLPPWIRIGAHDIKVVIIPDTGADMNGDALAGAFCEASQRLTFVEGPPSKSYANETAIHEVSHAILTPLNLEPEVEERVCTALGAGFVQVLRDNLAFVAWLFNKDSKKENGTGRASKTSVKARKSRRAL